MTEQENFDKDLHPDRYRQQTPENMTTAHTFKTAHNCLQQFNDDELKRIPVLEPGTRLEQGSVYLNLRSDSIEEWTAMGGETAAQDDMYVPKNETDYRLWNRLIGATHE